MKTSPWLILPLAAALCACVWLDDGPGPDARMRSDCGRGSSTDPPTYHPPDSGQAPDPPAPPDTIVWLSAVRFPKDYDWQRDTAYGTAAFELVLYRDFKMEMALPFGPDACFVADPDRHHILSGHLYTERIADGRTRIGRDGQELFHFEGREFLVGLLEDGDQLYTLSRSVSGQGFTFRRNGEILFSRTDGIPFGNLADPSYGPTGALYPDGGRTVFCYKTDTRGLYQVRDGKASQLESNRPASDVLDLKIRNGEVLLLCASSANNGLQDGRIWPEEGGHSVSGRFRDGAGGFYSGWMDGGDGVSPHRLCNEEAVLYHNPQATFAVSVDPDGIVRWYGPSGSGRSDGPCLFPGPGCAAAVGSSLVLALTPRAARGIPQIRRGGRVTELDLHGYVSSVAVSLSPPR